MCHEEGEPSLHPSLVRLSLEFNTSILGLPNPRDTWTPWGRVSPEEGEQDGHVAGALMDEGRLGEPELPARRREGEQGVLSTALDIY